MSKKEILKEKEEIGLDDLYHLKQIIDPKIRPNSDEVYYVINQANRDDNGYRNSIWRFRKEPQQFTQGLPSDFSMKWSPDGMTLAFISVRTVLKKPAAGKSSEPPKPQIYLIPFDGGEAIQLTKMPNGVSTLEWSQDGKNIVFISRLNMEELTEPSPEEMKLMESEDAALLQMGKKKAEEKKIEPRVITREVYRTGTAYLDDRKGQVHIIDLETKEVTRWTNSEEDDYAIVEIGPENSYVISARQKPGTGDESRIWEFLKITPDGKVEPIIKDHYAWGANFKLSPNGKYLVAEIGNEKIGSLGQSDFCLFDLETMKSKIITKEIDNSVLSPKWTKDSKYLYFLVFEKGVSIICRYEITTEKIEKIVEGDDKLIYGFDISEDNTWLAYPAFYVNDPSMLYSFNIATKKEKLIHAPNKKHLDGKKLGETEEIWYDGNNNDFKIQGWVLTPPDFDPEKKYPFALNMHGGPHVMWSKHQSIPMFHEFQLLAAEGYVVFYCNPRGSDGYGQEFYKGAEKAWGDDDGQDILKGVDEVVKRGFIDEKRMGLTGGSYGGFLTAWIVGHDTRFAAAVSQRGVYFISSFWATTDWARVLIDDEFGTTPIEDSAFLWERSPAAYAKNIKTPLCIIHSETDYRAPIPDAEMLYTAVKRMNPKLDLELVRYPGEGHELSRSGQPNRRLDRLQRIVDWFDKYCQPKKLKDKEKQAEKIKQIKTDYKKKMSEKIKELKEE
jgi:dipeptidyl aminopeptidase/acylaminoacyl peptidase